MFSNVFQMFLAKVRTMYNILATFFGSIVQIEKPTNKFFFAILNPSLQSNDHHVSFVWRQGGSSGLISFENFRLG
jgi:hypothetical protein